MPIVKFEYDHHTYVEPTKDDLKRGRPLRDEIVDALDSWAPNYIPDGRVESYDDWIDHALESLDLRDGTRLTCGDDQFEFPYTAIKRIAQEVAKDHR